jgi:DNA polymerase elongation subunit (family B)
VPYIICVELDETGQTKEGRGGLAERAYHRDELAANTKLRVDVEYYLANQVCVSPCVLSDAVYCPSS